MNIDNTPSINNLVTQVTAHIETAQWNKALTTIREFVEAIVRNPFCNGIILCVPALDNLCQAIGNAIPHEETHNRDNDTILYVASQLYLAGGHTAVIEDAIRAQPNKKHHLLITNIYNSLFKKKILKRFEKLSVKLHWADSWTMYGKFVWLRKTWIALNPASVFLFNHHQDAAIIAAATPTMPGDIYYYHHIDFQLGLGKSLGHTIHIDMNPLAFAECKQHTYRKHVYLPLTCQDKNPRVMKPSSFMKDGKLHTANSGSLKKFTTPYPFSYAETVPEILRSTGGKHTHIGPLDQNSLTLIKNKLRMYDISPDQFQHIKFTTSLWDTLKENEIDLFITSFPIGGGRTAIEVMGSGTPVIGHINSQSAFLSEIELLHPDSPTWKTPNELLELLSKMTPAFLSDSAMRGRTHYESYYLEDQLSHHFSNHFESCTTPIHSSCMVKCIDEDIKRDELLIRMSEYMANGNNIEGRGIPRIISSLIKKIFTLQYAANDNRQSSVNTKLT